MDFLVQNATGLKVALDASLNRMTLHSLLMILVMNQQ
jgi:hypothetical protein